MGGIMTGVARTFFIASFVFGVAGLLLGLSMAMSGDHGQMPTHAHIMVVGWLSFAAFGLFYHLFPVAAAGLPARIHLWLAIVSFAVLVVSLYAVLAGNPGVEPAAATASIGYLLSFLTFIWAAWPVVVKRGAPGAYIGSENPAARPDFR
jgi:hypothetical protein